MVNFPHSGAMHKFPHQHPARAGSN